MKILILFVITALSCTTLWAENPDFIYAAVIFRKNQPETIASGHLDAATFQKSFATSYPVAGARIEIPKGATPFGALFIHSETVFLTMPFYYSPEGNIYICQSHSFGEAPEFRILARTQDSFIATIKKKLANLETHHKTSNQSLERTLSVANSVMREPIYASLSSGR